MALPLKGVAYTFLVGVSDAANPANFRVNPTIAAGDFQVSTDGSAFANLATLPVVSPAGSITILISLSAAEMNGDKVNVQGIDVAGNEWESILVALDLPAGTIETMLDIEKGDRIETSTGLRINKAGTATPVLDKDITGSLLPTSVTITTKDA